MAAVIGCVPLGLGVCGPLLRHRDPAPHMRDPIMVRRHEIRSELLRHVSREALIPPLQVFTLQPNAASVHIESVQAPDDFPPEAAHLMQTMTYVSALIATILDTEQILRTTEKILWVDINQRFSDWLDGETGRPGPQKRRSVDILFLDDIKQEIAEEAQQAGLNPSQTSRWIRGPMFRDMERMSSVGIYRSVLQDRHLNVGTTWTTNDLTDMIYLSAATGYADVVVAERHMTSMLGQAQRRLGPMPRSVV